jgi:hypothetical protein
MPTKKKKQEVEKLLCVGECGKEKRLTEFYMSSSPVHPFNRYPICKDCLLKKIDVDDINSLQETLIDMNKPFIKSLWDSTLEKCKETNKEPFGTYMKNLSLKDKNATWKDSEFDIVQKDNLGKVEVLDKVETNQDRQDVIRMLGYDPFENESKNDRLKLYSRLIDFLDESTLEDGLKLQSVIEIVKGFNQSDKINDAITTITNDISKLSSGTTNIKMLIEAKKNILTSVLNLAKENGISVKHSLDKSKGAGTLSGIIKQLNEKGLEDADINIYDIETYEGMRKVADISNRSIVEQLMLNENDYTEMIKDQRDMIRNLDERLIELEEENRLLKIKIKQYESYDN